MKRDRMSECWSVRNLWKHFQISITPSFYHSIILLALALTYALLYPQWNWDAIPYMALGHHVLGGDWPAAHAWVYQVVQTLPNADNLIHYEPYRTEMAGNAAAFEQVAAFYQARVGYYLPLAGLMKLGFSGPAAIQSLSLLAQVGIAGVIALWLRRLPLPVWGSLLIYAFLLFNPTVMNAGRMGTPDGLVAAFFLMGLYGLTISSRPNLWGMAWTTMVLLRPNTAVWLLPLGAWALLFNRGMVLPLALSFVAAFLLMQAFPNYALGVLWVHSFDYPFSFPAQAHVPMTLDMYWHTLSTRAVALHGRDLVVWSLMAVGTVVTFWKAPRPMAWLAVALIAGAVIQFLMFPAFWERYFVGQAVGLVLLAATHVAIGTTQKRP